MAFLTSNKLEEIGFKSLGKGVLISDKCSIYGAENISIGDFSRIDDFCILSASAEGIEVGRYVHISCYASLIGRARISLGDYVNISGRVSIYSSSDDFSGAVMTGPLVGEAYTNVKHAPVIIHKHTIVGAGTIVLPGVTLHKAVAVGALSLVTKDCNPFSIYAGVPAVFKMQRKNYMIAMENELIKKRNSD